MTKPTKAIQDLEVINVAHENDLLLVVNSSNGKVHLIKKSSLIKESEQQIPLSPIKKFKSLTEAKASEAEEYDIAVIAGRIYVYVNGGWKPASSTGGTAELKKATKESAGVVKLATTDDMKNFRDTDSDGNPIVPKVSDFVPSYIGATFLAGSNIFTTDTVYLHTLPTYEECTKEFIFGRDEETKIWETQAISNGMPFEFVEFKLGKVGLPTTQIFVEVFRSVRSGRYWTATGEALAKATLDGQTINQDGKYIARFPNTVKLPEDERFVFRLTQERGIVNSANHYKIFGHPTRVSDIFTGGYVVGEQLNSVWSDMYLECAGIKKQVLKKFSNGERRDSDTTERIDVSGEAHPVKKGLTYPINLGFPEITQDQPITISGSITFSGDFAVNGSLGTNNGTVPYFSFLNKKSEVGEFGTITFDKHPITFDELKNAQLRVVPYEYYDISIETGQSRYQIDYDFTVHFTDRNINGDEIKLHIRKNTERFKKVVATLLGEHSDGSFIALKDDGTLETLRQKGEDGKRIIIKTENKSFFFQYEGDENRIPFAGFQDFVGPAGPAGPQGERGKMGGINYRGIKSNVSELPAVASIEGEAYSVGDKLYIRDSERFSDSGLLTSNISAITNRENILNVPEKFTPIEHTHNMHDIEGLENKQNKLIANGGIELIDEGNNTKISITPLRTLLKSNWIYQESISVDISDAKFLVVVKNYGNEGIYFQMVPVGIFTLQAGNKKVKLGNSFGSSNESVILFSGTSLSQITLQSHINVGSISLYKA